MGEPWGDIWGWGGTVAVSSESGEGGLKQQHFNPFSWILCTKNNLFY